MAALMHFLEESNRQVQVPLHNPDSLSSDGQSAPPPENQCAYPPESSYEQLREQLTSALEIGDEQRSRDILSSIYSAVENMATVADHFIAPVFHALGDRWICDSLEIYQERRACEICSRLIHELRRLIPEADSTAPLALGGSPEADYYSLPSQLVELVLRENHWQTMNLGSNLPLPTLLAAVRQHRPRLLWLSVSYVANPEEFVDQYREFHSDLPKDLLIVVGGRALTDELRPQLAYTAHCDTLQQLAGLAEAVRNHTPLVGSDKVPG
jgi:methanogenic corrinoid protein MtbC1